MMGINVTHKTVIIMIVCISVIVSGVFYVMYGQWEHRNNVAVASVEQYANMPLKFVAIIVRHGDRSPVFKYKTDPHANAFPEGIGELTKMGKQHAYIKGQFFRRLYKNYLNDLYLDSEILIKTTESIRTIMSAQLILAGMYPPTDYQKWSDLDTVWQPIPVYTNSPDHGYIFSKPGTCPHLDSQLKIVWSQIYNTETDMLAPLMLYFSEKTEESITITNLTLLYDLFMCQMSYGLQLPEWVKSEHIKTMKSIILNEKKLQMFFGDSILQKFIIGPLLKEIALNLEQNLTSSNKKTTRKMLLYSSHDISLNMALGFLGNNVTSMPGFGASLHFHLYLDEKSGYIVKVFYYDKWDNEKEEEILIPVCGNPCKLQDFVKLVIDNFSSEWEEECHKIF